ncbi:hypothetical protein BGW80DRAFT_1321209 [Lactifluus volemus]|nr:hypothetical protein BGW80DRAFT_1321209 [Lactifluus volemus]
MAQICNQLSESFIMSSIETLYIDDVLNRSSSTLQDVMNERQWLELFNPFTAVQTLYISQKIHPHIVSALRGLSGETATEVLPALENLYLQVHRRFGSGVKSFIIARQSSGHPVSLHPWDGTY